MMTMTLTITATLDDYDDTYKYKDYDYDDDDNDFGQASYKNKDKHAQSNRNDYECPILRCAVQDIGVVTEATFQVWLNIFMLVITQLGFNVTKLVCNYHCVEVMFEQMLYPIAIFSHPNAMFSLLSHNQTNLVTVLSSQPHNSINQLLPVIGSQSMTKVMPVHSAIYMF